jgi:hypothetical protein
VIAFGDATNAAIIGPVVVALLAILGAGWKFGLNLRDELRHRVGTPNGHGNVVQMLETLLNGQAGLDNRLAALEARSVKTDERVDGIASSHGERLGALEQDVAALKATPPCRTPTPTTGG